MQSLFCFICCFDAVEAAYKHLLNKCVKRNILYIAGPEVQVWVGLQPPSTGPACNIMTMPGDTLFPQRTNNKSPK